MIHTEIFVVTKVNSRHPWFSCVVQSHKERILFGLVKYEKRATISVELKVAMAMTNNGWRWAHSKVNARSTFNCIDIGKPKG